MEILKVGDRVELTEDWKGFTTPYLRKGHQGVIVHVGQAGYGVLMDEDSDKEDWYMSFLDVKKVGN